MHKLNSKCLKTRTPLINQALQSSAKLDAEAVKGLGLPRIDLNVRAYKFHSEVDVPLNSFKQGIENALNEKLDNQLNEWENVIPPNIIGDIENGVSGVIHDGVNMVPNYANLTLQDEQIRSSISMVMPLYTGGLLKSTKQIAAIQSQRSELNTEQQQDVQRFEMIQAYFNVQLQQQLLKSSQFNFNAMQRHLDNALKLEKQGFLSKGQRMQFEVARNNAQRLLQNAQANLQSSQFQLNNLLRTNQVNQLTTPLFVNKAQTQSLDNLIVPIQNSPVWCVKCKWILKLPMKMFEPSKLPKNQIYLLLVNIASMIKKTGSLVLQLAITYFQALIKVKVSILPNLNAMPQNYLRHVPNKKLKMC